MFILLLGIRGTLLKLNINSQLPGQDNLENFRVVIGGIDADIIRVSGNLIVAKILGSPIGNNTVDLFINKVGRAKQTSPFTILISTKFINMEPKTGHTAGKFN